MERDCYWGVHGGYCEMQRVYQIIRGLLDVMVAGAGIHLN
jgi:hypothetical protein